MSDSSQLAAVQQTFAALFQTRYNTHLIGGADEPFYRAALAVQGCQQSHHQLHYRADYPASALHEIAHWCIAGAARRQRDDFGYWYQPGARSAQRQREFEAAEVAPQALEWLFSRACGRHFQLSVDNFALDNRPPKPFAEAVLAQLHGWLAGHTLPARGAEFAIALQRTSGVDAALFDPANYRLEQLLAGECAA